MNILAKFLRGVAKLRFKALGHATIKDIPTDEFNALVDNLVSSGWRKVSEYSGLDAWIDYGRIEIRKDSIKLTLEWDNWTQGSIEGPRDTLEALAARDSKLTVTDEWRWSEYGQQ